MPECVDCGDTGAGLAFCCKVQLCPMCIKAHAEEGCDRMEHIGKPCSYCGHGHGSTAPAGCRAAHLADI